MTRLGPDRLEGILPRGVGVMRLSGKGSEYVYGAYVAALRFLAGCLGSGERGVVLEEVIAYLERVFGHSGGFEEAAGAAREVLGWLAGGDCRERVEVFEEENYDVIRRALYSVAGLELVGAQSWRARQAVIVLGALREVHGRGSRRLTRRGSLLVDRDALYSVAQRWAAPPSMREAYYVIEPWRRLEIEHNIGMAVEALSHSGVLVEAPSLDAYIVPAPYLEEDFIKRLREP